MASQITAWTLSDLLDRFGPIPAARIRWNPPPGEATEQDVVEIELHEDRLFELIDGVLLEKDMGFYESYLATLLARFLTEFVQDNDLGIVAGADGMLKLFPDQIRIPDISFVSWDKLPNRQVPEASVPELVPNLAVEVISKGNTKKEMDRKLEEFFAAGVKLVWYVYPKSRSVSVYTSPTSRVEVTESDSLEGGNVLPGFSLPLASLFEGPRQQSNP
jgi:Uma2 family endonuclease